MIPERYKRMLPPQWYENKLAEYHFEGATAAVDVQEVKRLDIERQFFPLSATWGLDIWEWIYFGKKQLLSIEERRKNIQSQHWAKLPFTMPVLKSLGMTVGQLLSVSEDFASKEIVFSFHQDKPVDSLALHHIFERMRPVHVNRERIVIQKNGSLVISSDYMQIYYSDPRMCGSFYVGGENSLC
ncbi:putative phage tail protein [uncultured Brevibacillus sp.]|uniref:putative phage tail protein n=1 Tax=uncultured Brevibacillus sp. TaxID=169970 RepID=UPI002595D9D8|nr:putative phage tail protein [uncultured Brevibacillus sp.]